MRGYKNHIQALLLLCTVISPEVHAVDNRIIWECNTGSYYTQKAEHNLWLVEDGSKSYVKFYDSRISARYYLHGLERRWDWEGGNFSVRLKPNNNALYFDFSNVDAGATTSAKSQFSCKKIKG